MKIVPIKKWLPYRYRVFRRAVVGYRYFILEAGVYRELDGVP